MSRRRVSEVLEAALTAVILIIFLFGSFESLRPVTIPWLWGATFYSFFPPFFFAVVLLAALFCILPGSNRVIIRSFDSLAKHLPWPGHYWRRATYLGLGIFSLCRIFSSKVNFLGDSRLLMRSMNEGLRFYPSDLVDFYLHSQLTRLLGSAEQSYIWLSSMAGGLYAVFSYFLARRLVQGSGARIMAFFWLLSIGAVVQFFGYAESYAFLLAGIQAYLLISLIYLDDSEKSPLLPFLLAAICCVLHPTGVCLLVSAFYLFIQRWLRLRTGKIRFILSAAIGLILPPAVVLIYFTCAGFNFRDFFTEIASRGSLFLPLWPEKTGARWILSSRRLLDLANLIIMVFPALLLLPFIKGTVESREQFEENRKAKIIFLALAAAVYLGFFFLLDNKIALHRDWDLFSIPGLLVAALFLALIIGHSAQQGLSRLLRLTALNMVALLPLVAVNSSEKISLDRFTLLADTPSLNRDNEEAVYNFEELAIYYWDTGKSDQAADYFRRAVELVPKFRYYNSLGQILHEDGKLKEAGQAFRRSLEQNPRSLKALRNLGNILLEMDEPGEAALYFEQASSLDPAPKQYFSLGLAYRRSGDLKKAEKAFEKALEMDFNYDQALAELSQTYLDLNEWDKAFKMITSLLVYSPQDLSGLLCLGDFYYQRGQYDESREIYSSLLSRYPMDWRIIDGLARVVSAVEGPGRAGNLFTRAVDFLPEKQLQENYALAETLLGHDEYALAEKCLRRVLKIYPDHLGARVKLARVFSESGRNAEALLILENLSSCKFTRPELWFDLRTAYSCLGNTSKAQACQDSLLSHWPDSKYVFLPDHCLGEKKRQGKQQP